MNFIERNLNNEEWIFLLGILILCLWISAKLVNRDRFLSFLSFFTSEKYTQERIRENKWFGPTEFILLCSGTICLSYLVCEFAYYLDIIKEKNIIEFLKIAAFVGLFLILKNLLLKATFYFFDIENYFKWYWFYKLIGFIWFTNALFVLYLWQLSVYKSISAVIVIGIFFMLLIYVWLANKLYKKYHQLIINQFLYFILYLCTLEIAPYFFTYKLIEAIKL